MGTALARAGRKRKTNVRRDGGLASGRSRGELVDLSLIFEQPHRRKQRNPKSELLGYPLGRLRHEGLIDEVQLEIGNAWAAMVRAYSRMIGLRIGSPKSGSMTDCVASGFYAWEGDAPEVEPEEMERRRKRLRGKYDLCHDRLHEAGRTLGPSVGLLKALRKVCIEERYPDDIELGNLRLALNVVGRVLRG